MSRRKEPSRHVVPAAPAASEAVPANAFDTWLQRGLHQLYDDIANEPVPEELRRLIEQDRSAK